MTDLELARPLPGGDAPSPGRRPWSEGRAATTAVHLLTFLLRRLALIGLVLAAIIFISYAGLEMASGTPWGEALRAAAPRTASYIGRALQGDLGRTTTTTSNSLPYGVTEVLPGILGKSFGLLAVSLLGALVIGLILGLWAAARRHSNRSLTILTASTIGISAPSFFIALLLQLAVIGWTRWTGRAPLTLGGFGWDNRLILPALVLAAHPIAMITRVTFLSVGEVLDKDYVRTARSKGIRPLRVLSGHVLRNAAIPILTTASVSLRYALSSLPIVEFFFGWPGAGFLILKSISRGDDDLTIALLLSLGLLFSLLNLLLELTYKAIDPRLRDRPEHLAGERRAGRPILADLGDTLRDLWADNPLRSWWRRRWQPPTPSPFRAILARAAPDERDLTAGSRRAANRQAWRRGTLGNTPFMIGVLIVTGLVVAFAFGPALAPHSPHTTQGLKIEGGVFSAPPFAPSEIHPWGTDVLGRDILSLVLVGAQQTLLLVTLVVAARLLVGFALGALAGWLSETWVDRLILGAAEAIAAFPRLILAMLLILALGIREGLPPFLIALCLVGWAEIMQYVRGEVMAIRPRPFIESAVAVGLRTPRIITSHVLPNLLSALIALAALEMGAVLMLLGELGFIGIFIGGGAFAELDIFGAPFHYSDVPEWGSLLSNVRLYARAYPWTAVYPTLAFFVAILGFNLLGDGLRRLIETVGVSFTRLLNRYTLLAGLLLLAGAGWVRSNTGAAAVYRQQALAFDGQRALAHVQALTAPAMEGRALGSAGLERAATYIAAEFEALGLQAAGENFTHFQTRHRDFERLAEQPLFTIDDGGPPPLYRQDYVEFPGPLLNRGTITGPVRLVALGPLTMPTGFFFGNFPALRGADFAGDILMVLAPEDAANLLRVEVGGILVVADDPADLDRHYSLSVRQGFQLDDRPLLWIDEATANRLLQGTGQTVAELRRRRQVLGQDERYELTTGVPATIGLEGDIVERTPVTHVVGHLPGLSDELDSQMIIVMAQYDGPAAGPGGRVAPGANDNASGVALMLELIRAIRASGYQPYKTFLFVAYSGEGWEGGNPVNPPDVNRFLAAKYGFASAFTIEAVVDLRGVGAGAGDEVAIGAGGSLRLANLAATAARRLGIPVTRAGDPVDISIVFDDSRPLGSGQDAPQIGLHWAGWEATRRRSTDTLATISAGRLEQVGRTAGLTLMIVGREREY